MKGLCINKMKLVLDERLFTEDIESVRKNYPKIEEDKFYELIKLDPTFKADRDSVGTYGKWILNLYNKGNLKEEDFYKVTEYLSEFEDKKKLFKNKDIGQFKSLPDLYSALQDVDDSNLSHRQQVRQAQKDRKNVDLGQDAKKVFENSKVEIWIPETYAASCKLGQDTSWCTATTESDRMFNYYTSQGPLFIIIDKHNPENKWQFHFESNQFMDRDDREVNAVETMKELSVCDFFKPHVYKMFGLNPNEKTLSTDLTYEELADYFNNYYEPENYNRDALSGKTIASILTQESVLDFYDYGYLWDSPITQVVDFDEIDENNFNTLNELIGVSTPEELEEYLDNPESEYSEEIKANLYVAEEDTRNIGAADAAYNDLINTILHHDNRDSWNTYYVDVTETNDGFNFSIDTKELIDAYLDGSVEESGYGVLHDVLNLWAHNFYFYEPQYGWDGWDKDEFNNQLEFRLEELQDKISKN